MTTNVWNPDLMPYGRWHDLQQMVKSADSQVARGARLMLAEPDATVLEERRRERALTKAAGYYVGEDEPTFDALVSRLICAASRDSALASASCEALAKEIGITFWGNRPEIMRMLLDQAGRGPGAARAALLTLAAGMRRGGTVTALTKCAPAPAAPARSSSPAPAPRQLDYLVKSSRPARGATGKQVMKRIKVLRRKVRQAAKAIR